MPRERALLIDCQGARLLGILHEAPAGSPPRPGVMVIVGGPQYRVGSHRQFVLMARQLAAAGYPVLRFDYRGMGDSEGEVRPFDAVDDDIRAALDAWCAEDPALPGVVLWGLCDGASAAMIYCSQDARVVGLVAVNPWVRTDAAEARSYVKHYYLQRLLQESFWTKVLTLRFDLRASLADLGRKLALYRRVGLGESEHQGATFIGRMGRSFGLFQRPVLIQLSGDDLTAQQFVELFTIDPHWRSLVGQTCVRVSHLADSDHTFAGKGQVTRATADVLEWLREMYLVLKRLQAN